MNFAGTAIGSAAGAIIGSFLATICIRWPRGDQVTSGRSRCDGCARPLRAVELIPIVAALASGGRCRTCGSVIAGVHVQVELAAAALSGIALYLQPNVGGAVLALFWLLLLAPAVLDARHYWLPDRLTLCLAFVGLMLGGLVSGASLVDRLIGGACGYGGLFALAILYSRFRGREGLGAGDPKLLGAIGLWIGWAALPIVLLIASATGIALAVAMRRSRTERMPFGSLLVLATILWSGWIAMASAGRPF